MARFRYHELFDWLTRHDLKKATLTEKAGVSPQVVAKLAKGETVTAETIAKICEAFDLEPGDICKLEK